MLIVVTEHCLLFLYTLVYCIAFSVSNQETWTQYSSDIITRSQKERAKAKEFRDLIDQLLCKTATEMINQWNIVNAAFSDRIREYIKARTDLETHLSKVWSTNNENQPCLECQLFLLMMMTTTTMMIAILI